MIGKSGSSELGYERQICASASGNYLIISTYYLKNFAFHLQIFALSKLERPSSLDFLIVFVAWRSPPSVDFARAASTKTAKKHGFRAGSDDSLLPKSGIVHNAVKKSE